MKRHTDLSEFEFSILLVLMQLGEGAYGVPISQELERYTGHEVSLGRIYMTLESLEERGSVISIVGQPTPERGNRVKRYFRLTNQGQQEMQQARSSFVKVWPRVPQLEGGFA